MITFVPPKARVPAASPAIPGVLDTYLAWDTWQKLRGIPKLRAADVDDVTLSYLAEFIAPLGEHLHEVRGTLAFQNEVEARAVLKRITALRETRAPDRRQTGIGKSKATATLKEIQTKILPIELRYLAETEADPVNGDEYIPIEGGHWWRVREMTIPSVRLEAAVSALVYRSYYPFLLISAVLADLERHEDLFLETGEDPTDPDAVARVYDAYMIKKTLFPSDSNLKRQNVYSGMHRRRMIMTNYAASKPTHGAAIRNMLPTLPDRSSDVHKSIMAASAELRALFAKNAKQRSDPLADDFDDLLAAMRVRQRQALRMQRECVRVRKLMLKQNDDGEFLHGESLEFGYRERVVTPDGRRLVSSQRVYMVAHRASTLLLKGKKTEIAFQFLHVEADGEVRYKPWFVPLFECGSLLTPSRLSIDMRERRRKLSIDLEIPDLHDKPAGMVSADGQKGADLLEAGLGQGMTLIPVDAFAHAMVMAYAMVRVLAITMCRIGEAIQMSFEPSRWTSLNIDGRSVSAFLAIPKGWDEDDELPLDDKTVTLLTRLAKLTLEREGGTAIKPSPSSVALPEFKQRITPHVFGFRGRAMSEGDLNYMFRILCTGLGNFTSHAVRHASANAANLELIEMVYIKDMLRHRGKGTKDARHYAMHTALQKENSLSRVRQRRADLDELGPEARFSEAAHG